MNKIYIYLSSVFVIPFLSVLSIALFIISVVFPLAVLFELTSSFITNLINRIDGNFAFRMNFVYFEIPRLLWLPISIIFGILCILAGRYLWQVLLTYLRLF